MRIMLLSVKPSVYENISTGKKIFEHRKNFPNENILAYLYVSKPVKAIQGMVYLKNRHIIKDWETEFAYDAKAVARIKKYEELYRYAMEISSFQETNAIKLEKLKQDFESFYVPQSYIYLENKPLLDYIKANIVPVGKVIKHSFNKICSDQICIR